MQVVPAKSHPESKSLACPPALQGIWQARGQPEHGHRMGMRGDKITLLPGVAL